MNKEPVKKLGTVAFVIDERLSREKRSILSRIVTGLKNFADLEILQSGMTEDQMLEKLKANEYSLVLLPSYRYQAWHKVEAFFGISRTSGPTVAGYFCEPLKVQEIGEPNDAQRLVLLDFAYTSTQEALALIRALIIEDNRSGLKPLLNPDSPIFCEHWFSAMGQGFRFETVLNLPRVIESDWLKRANALRICMNAFWSLIYDEGPGKADFGVATTTKTARAYFQIGVDPQCLVMRLVYGMVTKGTPREVLNQFWYRPQNPTLAAQLLLQYADFVRVHAIPQSSDIEVVVGFLKSAPAEKAPGMVHTLWVDPILASLVKEVPFENPGPQSTQLQHLPSEPLERKPQKPEDHSKQDAAKAKFIQVAAEQIRKLKLEIDEKEKQIREMRSGGITTAQPIPAPEIEDLLDSFQERYYQAKVQISELRSQIADFEARGAPPHEIEKV
ncbi:MAG: hypothetical protein AABZ55_12440, partial [Bdellovibrionota bacterium]